MTMFRERFNELIHERGTMARLSEATEISTGLLSNYKNGKVEPSLPNAVAIADFFDVSLDWLAGVPGYPRDAHKRPKPSPALSPDEAKLVDDYRRADADDRPALASMAAAVAYAGEAKNEGKAGAVGLAGGDVKEAVGA